MYKSPVHTLIHIHIRLQEGGRRSKEVYNGVRVTLNLKIALWITINLRRNDISGLLCFGIPKYEDLWKKFKLIVATI